MDSEELPFLGNRRMFEFSSSRYACEEKYIFVSLSFSLYIYMIPACGPQARCLASYLG